MDQTFRKFLCNPADYLYVLYLLYIKYIIYGDYKR